YNDYQNDTLSIPNNVLDVVPSTVLGTTLDINNLERFGALVVPCPTGRPAGAKCQAALGPSNGANNFRAPYIEKFGFLDGGIRTGSGVVGPGTELNDQDFARESAQAAYDFTLG